jgi:hypothetical protein
MKLGLDLTFFKSFFLEEYISFRFVSGVISRERMLGFERMLWRVCRGNVFLRQAEIPELIEDPITVRFYSNFFF